VLFAQVHGEGTGFTQYVEMTRHYNHLDPTGSIAFDGQGEIEEILVMDCRVRRLLLQGFAVLALASAVAGFINCEIGWGQRGLLRSEGIAWPRSCLTGMYCFEVRRRILIVYFN
jgi:hypothetical protein